VQTDHNIKITTPDSDLYQIILEDLTIMKTTADGLLEIHLMTAAEFLEEIGEEDTSFF